MKTDKSKLHHHHRKPRTAHHPAAPMPPETAGAELTDLDVLLFRMERSPKQENL